MSKNRTCPKCGKLTLYHANGLYECPVPAEVTDALRAFKARRGVCWKYKLRVLWASGADEDLLGQARNMMGPDGIGKIKL